MYASKTKKSRISIVLICILVLSALLIGCSEETGNSEENYPAKSIQAIVPWSAGGGSDIAFRGYVKYLGDEFGQNIEVKNVTGGNGAVGWAEAAAAKADGYNMSLITFDILTNEALGTSSTTYRDFDIVNIFTLQGMVLITHSDYGYKSIDDFLNAAKVAKANGKQLTIGTNGDYGIWHQAGVLMEEATDRKGAFKFVPFSGSGDQTTEMLGKHLDAIITSPTASISHVKEGTLVALASMTEERIPAFPDVPTFQEAGYDVTYESFRALAFPKGVPVEILEKTRAASRKAFDNPEFQEWATETNIDQVYMDAEETAEYLETLYPKVEKVIKQFNIN
jgi:tripartite-type tricarboxylate transporter receptor subunit TctC